MCMGALPVCVSVKHRHAVPEEIRRGCQILIAGSCEPSGY